MHPKKSEVQIGKESFGLSSDYRPSPPTLLPLFHPTATPPFLQIRIPNPNPNDPSPSPASHLLSTPHKRLIMSPGAATAAAAVRRPPSPSAHRPRRLPFPATAAARSVVRHLLRRIHLRIRLLLLLTFPSLYLLLSSASAGGGRSSVLDFLSALALSSALLLFLALSLNALPSLPSLRLLLSRSSALFPRYYASRRQARTPVLWSIGSADRSDPGRRPASGLGVKVYSNGDVYEGEFHDGRCSGSGVYYYYMSGRYEGDWVDEKYDGYGVETWARGSRYRGQYQQGLRHGFGVYRFYTGDVYAGEWSKGQSHGCGVHTCEDGSRYVGEFKWGVKHGLGHYHFRFFT